MGINIKQLVFHGKSVLNIALFLGGAFYFLGPKMCKKKRVHVDSKSPIVLGNGIPNCPPAVALAHRRL